MSALKESPKRFVDNASSYLELIRLSCLTCSKTRNTIHCTYPDCWRRVLEERIAPVTSTNGINTRYTTIRDESVGRR